MKAIRIYGIVLWIIAAGLIVCTILVQRKHHISSTWIIYVLAGIAIYGGTICWWASKKPTQ